ncbi:MAG: pyridoxamine 5'-phosphate oxidase family protein [Candidatus Heimdallarchaeota archaeon]|nr:pyridoxamine 5'-phosphate oxidase family protein [Candidatus Heimdallarchaeota archaeon]
MNNDNAKRSTLNRIPSRGFYDKETINQIIDEAHYCHVSFVQNNQPFIIPTIHARLNNTIVLHGAKASRLLKHIANGNEVCIAITLMDGLVLARSVFHHSMNYRSVVIFGNGEEIVEEGAKLNALQAITDHILPGRWNDARQPNVKELNATTVVSVKIDEASAKIRTGPPNDEEKDYELPVWAGVIPVSQAFGLPVNDPELRKDIPVPGYVQNHLK